MAERERFELSVRDYRTHDFQSCALDQLSHLSVPTYVFYHIFCLLSSPFCVFYQLFSFFFLFSPLISSPASQFSPSCAPLSARHLPFFYLFFAFSRLLRQILSITVKQKNTIPSSFFQNDIYKKQNSCYNIR